MRIHTYRHRHQEMTMNGIARIAPPRTLALALAVGLSQFFPLATGAAAAPISYSTQGYLYPWQYGNGDVPGHQGEHIISFTGVTGGTVDQPGARFSSGNSRWPPWRPGKSTYYNNMAFAIDLTTSLGGNVTPSMHRRAVQQPPDFRVAVRGRHRRGPLRRGGDHQVGRPQSPVFSPQAARRTGPVPVLDLPFNIESWASTTARSS
jgi:hypothetical protein